MTICEAKDLEVNSMESKVYLMVDSGAARSVCPPSHAGHVKAGACKEVLDLVTASGAVIPKHGSKTVGYQLAGGQQFGVHYTVAAVKRPVLSVSSAVDQGTSWVFSPSGSFMVRGDLRVDLGDHPRAPLARYGDLFFLEVRYREGSGEALIMPVQAANAAPAMEAANRDSAAAAAGPEDSEMPPTEAAVRAKVEDQPVARAKRIPGEPTEAERAAHELTQQILV